MAIEFASAEAADIPQIRSLMRSAFQVPSDAPFLDPQLLQWKYIAPRPDWEGSRSYILKKGTELLAHCGVAPVRFVFPDREVSCVCFMDWAGSRALPGSGLLLMRRLMKLADVAVVVGGSPDTWSTIPHLGFQPYMNLQYYSRVVRPWRRFHNTAEESGWKRFGRLLRDTARTIFWLPQSEREWSWTPVDRFQQGPLSQQAASQITLTRHDADMLNYWLSCPRGTFRGGWIRFRGKIRGYAVLNRLGSQARIVDARVDSNRWADWVALYALAMNEAAQDPEISEVICAASSPLAQSAILANGFRPGYQASFFLYDPKKIFAGRPLPHWNLIDDDAALI
jgi:hypothetical protein